MGEFWVYHLVGRHTLRLKEANIVVQGMVRIVTAYYCAKDI